MAIKKYNYYDISTAKVAEKKQILEAMNSALRQLEKVAVGMLKDGSMHGCPYLHLEIAAQMLQSQYPCEECSPLKEMEAQGRH